MTFYSSLTKHVAGYIYRPTCNAFENCCDPSLYYSQLGKVLMETDLVVYVLLCSYIIYSLGLVLTAVCKPGGGQVKWTVGLSLLHFANNCYAYFCSCYSFNWLLKIYNICCSNSIHRSFLIISSAVVSIFTATLSIYSVISSVMSIHSTECGLSIADYITSTGGTSHYCNCVCSGQNFEEEKAFILHRKVHVSKGI